MILATGMAGCGDSATDVSVSGQTTGVTFDEIRIDSSLMDYRNAGMALIEQGISDTLCSMDPDLISWDTLEQVEVFFRHLDRHITDDIGFSLYEADAVPDRAVDLPAGILDFLDDFLLSADAQAHRLEGNTGYYA
jgi:hypothetical protein